MCITHISWRVCSKASDKGARKLPGISSTTTTQVHITITHKYYAISNPITVTDAEEEISFVCQKAEVSQKLHLYDISASHSVNNTSELQRWGEGGNDKEKANGNS